MVGVVFARADFSQERQDLTRLLERVARNPPPPPLSSYLINSAIAKAVRENQRQWGNSRLAIFTHTSPDLQLSKIPSTLSPFQQRVDRTLPS